MPDFAHKKTTNAGASKAGQGEASAAGKSNRVSAKMLQRAIDNPTPANLTPNVVMQLQRDYGNAFVANLVQNAPPTAIQRFDMALNEEGTGRDMKTYFDYAVKEMVKQIRKNKWVEEYQDTLDDKHPLKNAEFEAVWNNPETRKGLHMHMEKERYSGEVPLFLRYVEDYKKNPSIKKAETIYKRFMSDDASHLINLSSQQFKYYHNSINNLANLLHEDMEVP